MNDDPINYYTLASIEHTEALIARARANLTEKGHHWFEITREGATAKVRIFGDIGHFADDNVSFKDFTIQIGDAESVELLLDSFGGRGPLGFKLYEFLSSRNTRAVISGACYSTAYIVALSAKRIEVHPSAKILIHPTCKTVFGDTRAMMEAAYDLLRYDKKIKALILKRLSAHNKSPDLESHLNRCFELDKPVVIDATEAVEWGFADVIVNPTVQGSI